MTEQKKCALLSQTTALGCYIYENRFGKRLVTNKGLTIKRRQKNYEWQLAFDFHIAIDYPNNQQQIQYGNYKVY